MSTIIAIQALLPIPTTKTYLSHGLDKYSSRCPSSSTPRPRLRCSLQVSDPIQTGRRSGGYPPALWDFDTIQSLNTEYKGERHMRREEDLIGQVREMLVHEEVDLTPQLELIDDLHKLGISCHFENEILQILKSIYLNQNYKRDLYSTSLAFRLLRQNGFILPQEVFDCFKNEKGTDFKPSLSHDRKGLLQLYEASFLSRQGEETLQLAREFATKILQKEVDERDFETKMGFPSHWRVQMPNARLHIDAYRKRTDMNPVVLELAILDTNIVQAQFQEELKETSRWWESTSLVQELPFVRDRIVECYLWTTGVIQRREHGYERIMLTKINALVTTIDDVFDIYGTLEELQLFTTTIQRWDLESMKQLPPYMQLCYLALHKFVIEEAYETLKEKGFNSIPYVTKWWVNLVESYMKEATWYYNGYKPSMQEYINNAWISIGGLPILSHLFFRFTDSIESMDKYRDMDRASCTILRLADDMGTSLVEVERGDVPKAIQCYMNETNASEEEAREYVRRLIEKEWEKMNTETMWDDDDDDFTLSKYYCEVVANLARMAQFIYQDGLDGFGMKDSKVNKLLKELLFERYE
uniref:1,8-cineole synthase n=2 Tax=Lavandula TaxID=39169 RepID=I3WEV8_LAVIN|nr:1,8-cineole synthase [Lavandula x intermedia]AFL03422.1 1,8-cineole synthase [Lavandula latifolia]